MIDYRNIEEIIRTEELIPSHLRPQAKKFVELLEDYYKFLNSKEITSGLINGFLDEHDLFKCSEPFLDGIHGIIASYIPPSPLMEKRELLKRIVKYFYNYRGSLESADIFFKVFFDTYVKIIMPVPDPFISSTGIEPLDNNNIKWWRPYSYGIKTTIELNVWEKPYRDLIHPAGFKFFAFLLISFSYENYWTDRYIASNALDYSSPLISQWFVDGIPGLDFSPPNPKKPGHIPYCQPGRINSGNKIIFFSTELGYTGRTHIDYNDFLKFWEPNVKIGDFKDYIILNAISIEKGHTWNPAQLPNIGSYIFSYTSLTITDEKNDILLTENNQQLEL